MMAVDHERLAIDIKMHNYAKGHIEHSYMKAERRNTYTVFEDINVDFYWDRQDVRDFERMWREGMCITDMAVAFDRPTIDVFLLALDRAERGNITARPGWIFGKGWRV